VASILGTGFASEGFTAAGAVTAFSSFLAGSAAKADSVNKLTMRADNSFIVISLKLETNTTKLLCY
jgi:hypothetical protein